MVAGTLGRQIEEAGGLLPLLERGVASLTGGTDVEEATGAVSRALGREAEVAAGPLPYPGRGGVHLSGGDELPPADDLQPRPDPRQLVSTNHQVQTNLAHQAAIPGTRSYVADPSGLASADLQQEIARASYVPKLASLTDVAVRSLATTAFSDAGARISPPPVDLLAWNGVSGITLVPFGRIQANPWGASLREGALVPPSEAAEEYTQTLLEELAHYATGQDHGQPKFEALMEKIRHSDSPQIAQVRAAFEQTFTVLQQSPEYQSHVRTLEALHDQWAASAP